VTQVNTRAAHASAVARMGEVSRQLDDMQGQIASARRVNAPADDPIAFARAAVLRRENAANAVTGRAIDAANRRLALTDTTLESVSNLVQRARELALQANNATMSADDRATIANELREAEAELRTLADARDSDGQRLFGGAIGGVAAFGTDADGVTVWQGGGRAPAVRIGSSSVAGGSEGPDVFGVTDAVGGTRDLFAALSALRIGLAEPDPILRAAAIETGIADMDGQVSRLADARGILGARLGRLESETDRLARADLAARSDLSKLEDLDMPAAIARLQRLLTVLEAAQASFSRVTSLSLWDQLR
jgi:flagellar hook-associated protein 3 FlgL